MKKYKKGGFCREDKASKGKVLNLFVQGALRVIE
jgi:hypothetical protein